MNVYFFIVKHIKMLSVARSPSSRPARTVSVADTALGRAGRADGAPWGDVGAVRGLQLSRLPHRFAQTRSEGGRPAASERVSLEPPNHYCM